MKNHMLIVDDLSINRDVLCNMFSSQYQVLEAASGSAAVSMAKEYEDQLALVLLDIRMPDINGLDILRMKKDGEILKNVPVIVITVADDPQTQLEAFKLGALDYINKPFVREIVEYRVANASLRTAYKELNELAHEKELAFNQAQQASQAKSRFLTRMSHELRTPMNAIIGLTQLIKDGASDSDMLLDRLDMSAHHLLGLLNEMMDITEIENGKIKLRPSYVCMNVFLDSIEAEVVQEAKSKGIAYNTDISQELKEEYYYFDEQKLRQVLLQLVNNALKFTHEGGSIKCSVKKLRDTEADTELQFTVKDTGTGISQEFLPHIYDEFEVENADNTTCYEGVGLGLTICRSIVYLMGGKIEVESDKNKGTSFMVTVSLLKAVSGLENTKPECVYSFKDRTLLLVEDHELNSKIMVRLLEKCHANVVTADNGKKAVEEFETSLPGDYDAILMDIRMPIMDGLEAARRIRSLNREDAKSIPIIAVTANAYEEDVKKSLDAGMNAHLAKPIKPMGLYETLNRCLIKAGDF